MSGLLSFDQVVEQAEKPHLLLGNGFSMAYDPDRFSYTSLLQSAIDDGIITEESEIIRLFRSLNTTDFERVIRLLDEAAIASDIYGAKDVQQKLLTDADALKEHLVAIVTNNHPEKSTSIVPSEREACLNFLQPFGRIYSLNYDLLLYWVIMDLVNSGNTNYTDGFSNTEYSTDDAYVVYANDSSVPQNLYFLHGALHLFDAGDEFHKITYNNSDVCLVDQIKQALADKKYPVFISEGTSEQKMEKIIHNAYLNHCYKSLKKIGGDIVIFGTLLKKNDEHILNAILNSDVKNIYLGVSNSSDIKHIEGAVEAFNQHYEKLKKEKKFRKDRTKTLHLYDYRTANVWGR